MCTDQILAGVVLLLKVRESRLRQGIFFTPDCYCAQQTCTPAIRASMPIEKSATFLSRCQSACAVKGHSFV